MMILRLAWAEATNALRKRTAMQGMRNDFMVALKKSEAGPDDRVLRSYRAPAIPSAEQRADGTSFCPKRNARPASEVQPQGKLNQPRIVHLLVEHPETRW